MVKLKLELNNDMDLVLSLQTARVLEKNVFM